MKFDKTKVYTALNADESLIGARGYFADSLEKLESYVMIDNDLCRKNNFHTVTSITKYGITYKVSCEKIDKSFFYLVEPVPAKPKYRPFKDCDELIETYEYKTNLKFNHTLSLPTIWVMNKNNTSEKHSITDYDFNGDLIFIHGWDNLDEFFNNYAFLDGSVCGVEE